MPEIKSGWWVVDGRATAWFDAPSLTQGAALVGPIAQLSPGIEVDLRATGLRVRLDSDEQAEEVSAMARDLGLVADPGALQQLSIVVDSTNPAGIRPFWQAVLAYGPGRDGRLVDPHRRDPAMQFRASTDRRPLRNRIHLDVVRPGATIDRTDLGETSGPFGIRHRDLDGNEVDLVPGDPFGQSNATDDWHEVFSAMAGYRTTAVTQQQELATTAAALADEVGFPLLIDLRPGLVIIDSGKDQWAAEVHGLDVDFAELAGNIQSAAGEIGATADAGLARFVQLFFDAADVAAARAFWMAALGYVADRRDDVTDIGDPRGLNPTLVFQQIDLSETARRQQRNRIHVELAMPSAGAPARLAAMIGAGGTLLDESENRWRVADLDGNEMAVIGQP